MDRSHIFAVDGWPELSAGSVRLTRLNIYAGLYIEFRQTRILVDPSKIVPEVAAELEPDLILVSHESMDHFDPLVCRRLLERETTILIGSWGAVISLTDHLAPDDPTWGRVFVGVPGTSFHLGDLVVHIEPARHCEYPVPIFFDIEDTVSGFRILDAVDSEITPRMEQGDIPAGPDILVVPVGIALAASPAVAWKMVGLLQPTVVFANHFTSEGDEFRASAPVPYDDERLVVLDWYEGVTLPGPDPRFDPHPRISVREPADYPDLAAVLADWVADPPTERVILDRLGDGGRDRLSLSTALYFLAWGALRGGASVRAVTFLDGIRAQVAMSGEDELVAAFLLTLGATVGSTPGAEVEVDIGSLKELMAPDQPYIDYWVLECWGRCARNPVLRDVVTGLLDEVVSTDSLYDVVAVRRKLMWEVNRMVEFGHVWPALSGLLMDGRLDGNPDVRLLTYKVLSRCHSAVTGVTELLAAGLADEHEDVLEWAVLSHIHLFDVLEPASRREMATRLPSLLTHPNYHVRHRANALTELEWKPPDVIEDHGLEVDLQITNRCPLRCDHCVYDSSMADGYGLPRELIDRLCGEFEELRVSQVSITGGEPFLRKDLLDVISGISARGIEVCVQTSGLFVDRIDFGALARSGLAVLLVSIDGLREYHDEFRHRRGTFANAWDTVFKAKSHGIPVRINTVVTRSNAAQVLGLLPVALDMGVDIYSFFYFSPVGRGAQHAQEVLSFSEWSEFEHAVRDWSAEHGSTLPMGIKLQNVAVPAASIPPSGQHCRIGDRDNILIMADGGVYPCVFVCHRDELCSGNVFEQSLTDIWRKSAAWTTRYDPFFVNGGTDCGGAVGNCSGGCPAMRDLMRSDDGHCDRRCEWETSTLVPGCAREYMRIH